MQTIQIIVKKLVYLAKEIIENLTKIENLDTIKEFKEETLEVLDTMVKDSLNLSKK